MAPIGSYDDLPITFNEPGTTSRTARVALHRMRRLTTRLHLRRQNPRIEPYLLDGERVVIIDHRHIASIIIPMLVATAGFAGVLYCWGALPGSWTWVRTALALSWLVLFAWALWSLVEWRTDWFVATDKRLLKIWGVYARRVPMMPLSKVTDMTFVRSVPGRLFGYGKFVLESAGQDQALREINYVRDPEETYRRICAEMFGVDDRDRLLEVEQDDLEQPDDDGSDPDPEAGNSRQMPVRRPGGETLYSSLSVQEEGRRRHQLSRTGPLPVADRNERGRRDNSGNQD